MKKKTIAIEVQKMKQVFTVFPYKFKLMDGEFKIYLDDRYLNSSLQSLIRELTSCKEGVQYLTFKMHLEHEVSSVLSVENVCGAKYGTNYVSETDGIFAYLMLSVVPKDIANHKVSKYVVNPTAITVEEMSNLLDLNLTACTKVEECDYNLTCEIQNLFV